MTVPSTSLARTTLAIAALLGACGLASGQARPNDGGPIIVGENVGKYNWWDLQYFRTELEFRGDFREDRLKSDGEPDVVERENRIRFLTNLSFQSYVGHKNLIDLTGEASLGYEELEFSSSRPDSDSKESPFTNFYNITARILNSSQTPITVYSRRDETITSREFASSLRTDTTEHGAFITFENEKLPTRIQYFHREQNQSDPIGSQDSASVQDTVSLQTQARLTDNQRIELTYTFDHVSEDQGSFFEDVFDRHDGTFTHYLTFGKDNRDELRSNLRFFDRSGEFDQSILRLDERMVLYHTDRLESRYNFFAEDQTRQGQDQRLIGGDAQLRHKLFDSLVSSVTGGANSFEVPDEFTSTNSFVRGAFDYTKVVPYGRLDASVGVGFNHQDNSDRGTNILITDETYTFVDPLDVVISRRNVVPASIRITNLASGPAFIEGVDYDVDASIAEVRIRRLPAGSILNGQSVLISYEIGPEPGSQIDTTTQVYSVRYTINEGWLDGLSLYSVLQITSQSVSTIDPSLIVLDDFTDWRFGAEYRIGDMSFLAEQQFHDSTISPYDRLRLEARYDRRLGRTSLLSILLSREEVEFTDINNRIEFNRVQARWKQQLSSTLDATLYLQYRDEHDSQRGDTQGFEQSIELNWNFRQTRIYGSFRNSFLDGDSTERTSQTFLIGVSRSF